MALNLEMVSPSASLSFYGLAMLQVTWQSHGAGNTSCSRRSFERSVEHVSSSTIHLEQFGRSCREGAGVNVTIQASLMEV